MNSKNPFFKTERLLLKKVQPEDHLNIYKGLSHPQVIRYYGVQYSSLEETEEQMKWYSNLEKSGSGMWWTIKLKENNHFCGAIGYNDLQEEHKKAEIGFWLLPEFWGKGFVMESAEKILEYLFEEIKIHRLEAFVEETNFNSSKVLGKLGFQYECTMEETEIKNGEYINVEFYGKINPSE